MNVLHEIKRWMAEITEIALLLVALAIVAEILVGGNVPFLGSSVVANLTALISSLGENGLVGLIVLGIVIFLFRCARTAT